jgi:hypothetical protein
MNALYAKSNRDFSPWTTLAAPAAPSCAMRPFRCWGFRRFAVGSSRHAQSQN